jgi:NADH-quinone oxidoreductase subunit M
MWMPVVATVGLLLGAAYYLWTIQRMFFGPFAVRANFAELNDLTTREYAMLLPLAIMALLFGILPQILLDYINPFAESFTRHVVFVRDKCKIHNAHARIQILSLP